MANKKLFYFCLHYPEKDLQKERKDKVNDLTNSFNLPQVKKKVKPIQI